MALNGWAAPSRPCSGPAIASLRVGAQLLVQGSVLSSTAAGPTRRTLLLRLDEVELLVLPTETEAEAGAVAVGAGDEVFCGIREVISALAATPSCSIAEDVLLKPG